MSVPKPIVLAILDGWGEWNLKKGNAISQATLPTINKLNEHYPKLYAQASGRSVGLPAIFPGNSEVGHQTLGSGQITFQHLPLITQQIANGSFYNNEVLINAMEWGKKRNGRVHLVGLLSDGGVHSHIEHLIALLSLARRRGVSEVFIHAFTDGRDTPPTSAEQYILTLQREAKQIGVGKLATICGRYYGMDRNENWDRVEKSFLAMTKGEGEKSSDPVKAVEEQYDKEITDEYFEPIVITDEEGEPITRIENEDAVICFNFRKDRSKQLAKAFTSQEFDKFERVKPLINIRCVGFKEYEKGLNMEVAFHHQKITTRLGEALSQHQKKQYRIAETEKYAHVTYFFNGGKEDSYPGEERKIIPSKNVRSYADKPEMSAEEITDHLLKALESEEYDFLLVNYANADMVGHTGDMDAGIKAVETVDRYLDKVIDKVLEKKGHILVTADHGNIEEMINLHTSEKSTNHSNNPVPWWYVTPDNYIKEKPAIEKEDKDEIDVNAMLIDIAPTILELMDIKKPREMMGRSMIDKFKRQQGKKK